MSNDEIIEVLAPFISTRKVGAAFSLHSPMALKIIQMEIGDKAWMELDSLIQGQYESARFRPEAYSKFVHLMDTRELAELTARAVKKVREGI